MSVITKKVSVNKSDTAWKLKIFGVVKNDLEFAVSKFIAVANTYSIKVSVVPLPTKKDKFTVLSSPFIYKSSMKAYERTIHRRLLYIYLSPTDDIRNFSAITLPNGVELKIKMPSKLATVKKSEIGKKI